MAGPFDVNPNSAAEISPIQLRGGFQPPAQTKVDIGAAIGEIAQSATGVFVETQRAAAVEDIQEEAKVLRTALDAQHNPAVRRMVFDEAAKKNPYYQRVVTQLGELRSAIGAGRLSYDYAVERAEDIIKTATEAMPGFTRELKGAAQEVLGFEPSQRVVAQQLARLQAADKAAMGGGDAERIEFFKKTEHPKVVELIQLTGQSDPESVAAFRKEVMNQQAIETDYEASKRRVAIGELAVNDLVNKAYDLGAQFQTQALGMALQQLATGEGVDSVSLSNMVTSHYEALKQDIIESAPSGTNPRQHFESLDKQRDQTIRMLENNDVLKIAQRHSDLFDARSGVETRQIPIFGRIYSVFGENPAMMEEVFKAMQAWKSSPETFPTFLQTDKGAPFSMAMVMSGFGSVVNHLENGTKPGDPAELQKFEDTVAFMSSLNIRAATKGTEVKESFARMVDQTSSKNAMIYLTKPSEVRKLAQFKEVHPDVINAQNNEKRALQLEFNQLRNAGHIPEGGIEIDTSGKTPQFRLTFDTAVRDESGTVIGVDEQASASLQATGEWLRRTNRLLTGFHYTSASGITPESVYAGPEQLAGFFNRTIEEQVKAAGLGEKAAEKPKRRVYDPNTGGFIDRDAE